jgi:hypothetical protein
MLTFTAKSPRATFHWTQILGVITAILMLGSSAQALTRGEKEIQKKLPAGTTLDGATDEQFLTAMRAAMANPTNSHTLTSEIVKAAMKYVPNRAPDVVSAGLSQVKSDALPASLETSEGKTIVSTVMKKSLQGVPNQGLLPPNSAADRAAAITAAAVEVVKDQPSESGLFVATIKGAVSAGAEFQKGSKNGAAGAVTGAIAVAAGQSNDDLAPATPGTGDALVTAIIKTAAKKAPQRALEIAEAAGYAFAFAYRGTTSDANEITIDQFLTKNLEDIFAAVALGLPPKKANSLAVKIHDRVRAGIALAYGGISTNGAKGINNFVYTNGVITPVSDIAGL